MIEYEAKPVDTLKRLPKGASKPKIETDPETTTTSTSPSVNKKCEITWFFLIKTNDLFSLISTILKNSEMFSKLKSTGLDASNSDKSDESSFCVSQAWKNLLLNKFDLHD